MHQRVEPGDGHLPGPPQRHQPLLLPGEFHLRLVDVLLQAPAGSNLGFGGLPEFGENPGVLPRHLGRPLGQVVVGQRRHGRLDQLQPGVVDVGDRRGGLRAGRAALEPALAGGEELLAEFGRQAVTPLGGRGDLEAHEIVFLEPNDSTTR